MNITRKRKRSIVLTLALVAVLITAGAVLARGASEKPAFSLMDLGKTTQDNFSYEDGAFVILALDDHGPTLTGQALVDQIHTFLGACASEDSSADEAFATGPNDLFPPAGIDNCPTPGLVNLQGAWVIIAPGGEGPTLTEGGQVEQIRALMGGCGGDDNEVFATGPNDLFPPAGIDNCPTPGLVNLQGAWVIIAPGGEGPTLTEGGQVEQIRALMGGCGGGADEVFATGPNDLFPPAGIDNCPTIIRLPQMPQS